MLKYTLIIKEWVYIGAVIFFCFIGYKLFVHVETTLSGVDTTLVSVNQGITSLNSVLTTVAKPKIGTLAVLHDSLMDFRLSLDGFNKILIHEQLQLTKLDNQESTLFADLHDLAGTGKQTMQDLGDTARAGTTTLNATTTAVGKTGPVVDQLSVAVKNVNNLATDPNIKTTIASVASTMKHVDGVADSSEKVAHHYEQAIDNPKPMSFWQKARVAGDIAWHIAMLAK